MKSLLKLDVTNAIIVVLDLFAGLLVSAVQTNVAFCDAYYVKIEIQLNLNFSLTDCPGTKIVYVYGSEFVSDNNTCV